MFCDCLQFGEIVQKYICQEIYKCIDKKLIQIILTERQKIHKFICLGIYRYRDYIITQRRFRSGITFQGRGREEALRLLTPGFTFSLL